MKYDVVVYDSTSSGIISAIAAAEAGCSVALISEDRHVGGMQTSGLGWTNAGQRITVGGLTRKFHDRLLDYYQKTYGEDSEQVGACQQGFRFESSVAEKIFTDWLAEAGVECFLEENIVSAVVEDARVRMVRTDRDREFEAAIFIDASYEGDLMKLTGCDYHLGREGMNEFGESLAGVRYPPQRLGEADRAIQPFDYRLCLTDNPDNRVAPRKPDGYDPSVYAYHAACFRHDPPKRAHQVVPLNPMPNRKTDSRTGEWVGGSWDYPEADGETRRRIAAAHRNYSAGYLWFAMTDESIPKDVRDELAEYGHAADEFVDNGHWPYHMYVREARRLRGEYVMTQRDVTEDRFKPDGVALGSFFLDVHPVQLIKQRCQDDFCEAPSGPITENHPDTFAPLGLVKEGGLGRVGVKPYEIPYRALLPRREQAANLLVPVALSATHVAFSTIRMEPVWSMLGHAAGLAAGIVIQGGGTLHELEIEPFRQRLREAGQIVDAGGFDKVWS